MNRIIAKTISCFMLGAVIIGLQAFAEENAQKRTIYKFKYNNVPLKQPVITQSMKPAIAEYNQGNYLGAMIDLKKVVENEPDNVYAKYYLALCYTNLGYKSEAQNLYNEIATGEGDNYALKYYSQRAKCIEEPDDEICLPPVKVKAPDINKKPEPQETAVANREEPTDQQPQEEDDMTKFIKSGKKIHPAAMDRISRERAERKMQEDIYKKQQADMEAQNQQEQ